MANDKPPRIMRRGLGASDKPPRIIMEKIKIKLSDIENLKSELPVSLSRRVPTVFQAAFLATKEVLKEKKADAVICVSSLGCLDETISFLDKLINTTFGSPKDFVFSVHNSLGAMLAKEFSITGANITLTDTDTEKAVEVAELLDEKTILIVEFDDANKFAGKILKECDRSSAKEPFASAFLYEK